MKPRPNDKYKGMTNDELQSEIERTLDRASDYWGDHCVDGYLYEADERVYSAMMHEVDEMNQELARRKLATEATQNSNNSDEPAESELPDGLEPEWTMEAQRIINICSAITRYVTYMPRRLEIPDEWMDELVSRIENWNSNIANS